VNRWVYPHVKALEETLIANSAARSVVIRVFNTYGLDMDFPEPKRVVPHFIDRVLAKGSLMLSGDGMQRRSFCYVDDMIRGMVLALAYAAAQAAPFSRCFNLGSSTPITIRELAEQIVKVAVELGLLDEPTPSGRMVFNTARISTIRGVASPTSRGPRKASVFLLAFLSWRD
jgi:nucleoside-diphosphate-sugar epimerase